LWRVASYQLIPAFLIGGFAGVQVSKFHDQIIAQRDANMFGALRSSRGLTNN